jgi:hypothetical protein
VAFDEGNIVESAAGNGNKIQRLGPGNRHFDFCRGQGAPIVQPLELDLIKRAPSWPGSDELPGEPEPDDAWTWLTFRAPNGNIHGPGARIAQLPGKKIPLERARYAAEECAAVLFRLALSVRRLLEFVVPGRAAS